MNAESIASIVTLLIAVATLIGMIGQRDRTIAKVATDLIEPMTRRIDQLQADVIREQKARQNLQKKVIRLVEGIRILTRQLKDNGIDPEFILQEDDASQEGFYDEN